MCVCVCVCVNEICAPRHFRVSELLFFMGEVPQTPPPPIRASHLQCSQFWLSALKPPHIYLFI